MGTRSRSVAAALVAVGALVVVGLAVPAAQARASAKVPRVSGLAAAGSNLAAARLAVKWKRVKGATYQVRFGTSTASLAKAPLITTRATAAWSQVLSSTCPTWYAQVRAKKKGRFGAWSARKALKFSTGSVAAATPITTGQTSSNQAQVRWVRKPGAAGYRLHYSPGPYGNWPGYFPYTATTAPSATGTAVNLPAVGPGDRMMGAAYGNPLFVQLETKKCSGTYAKAQFTSVWPKGFPAGDATTGSKVRVGSYNLENAAAGSTKIDNIADNIAKQSLDVVALQEAFSAGTDLKDQLSTGEGQTDWETYTVGAQQIMWRSSAWSKVDGYDVGMPAEVGPDPDAAKTPLPTPAVRLTPATPDPTRSDILVTSVHLEDRDLFVEGTPPVADRKQDAHEAAVIILDKIEALNPQPGAIPVIAAGDFKGNFGGGGQPAGAGYCDENSTPFCAGEGQPTFIRAGYIDAQAAESKSGVEYGTVNKHLAQTPNPIGFGGRADYILFRGFPGVAKYVNVVTFYGDVTKQPDHNLVYAEAYVPFVTP